ncbi:MAG TPA: ATP-binding SpoIIE family protein phosphatase [Nitrospira sp.]|nr:ATP-binding SpoIIE family protein phosphatase [Nitrospira sp.]
MVWLTAAVKTKKDHCAPMNQMHILMTDPSQSAAARRMAVELARKGELDEAIRGNVALVVTELATNLAKHASQGEMLFRLLGTGIGPAEGFEVLSLDRGPGIADPARALADGYSTAGSPGTGLGAVVRAATEFDVFTQEGQGTAVVARIFPQGRRVSMSQGPAVGVVHRAMQGEEISGDAWLVRSVPGGWLCTVADGLGHGPIAAEAALPIIETVRTATHTTRAIELLEAAHRAARPTRGAAFGVAVIDEEDRMVRFAGIGNVAAVVLEGERRRQLVSYDGILGHSYRKVAEMTDAWSPQTTLVLHSDGISTHWDMKQYPGLLSRDPSLIAGVLYRDSARGRDDATIVVVNGKH